jgi:hypothetical protein
VTALELAEPIASALAKPVMTAGKPLGYRILYNPTPGFQALKRLEPNIWSPRSAWSVGSGKEPI